MADLGRLSIDQITKLEKDGYVDVDIGGGIVNRVKADDLYVSLEEIEAFEKTDAFKQMMLKHSKK